MRHQALVGLCIALAVNDVLVGAAPGFSIGDIRFGKHRVYDKVYENVGSKTYNIIEKVGKSKGACVKHVTATGNGVGDVIDLPCRPNGVLTITSDTMMIYGNPKLDTFSLFSDSPSTMIVFLDGKCTERKYLTVTGQTYSEIFEISEDECKNVQNKISYIIDKESKYVDVLDKNVDEELPQSPKPTSKSNRGKTSYKSASETAASVTDNAKQQNKPTDTNQGSTYTSSASGTESQFQKNQESPLGLNSVLQAPSDLEGDNLKPVSVTHQQTSDNGITVIEQVSTSDNKESAAEAAVAPSELEGNNLKPVSVSHQQTSDNGITVIEQVSTSDNKESAAEAAVSPAAAEVAAAVAELVANTPPAAAPEPAAEVVGSKSYLNRIYSNLKTKVSTHVHNPLDHIVHKSHF